MWISAVFVIAFGFTLKYFLFYRDWLHWQKETVFSVRPGPCQTVRDDDGTEDVVHIGDGIFIMSSVFKSGQLAGEVIGLDVNGSQKILTINKTGVPESDEPLLALAHGMTTWKDETTGKLFLYVLTHPPSEDKVRVFEVQRPLQLKYIKTITDPNFTFMNDLVAVGLDKFYIPKYTIYRDLTLFKLEHLSHLRQGKIFYYDGVKAREVSSGHFLPNGINVSPDKKVIYLAEWGGQKLHAFNRDMTNNLVKAWEVEIGTGVDNIDVDEKGNLWIGCSPITWQVIDYLNLFGATQACQVLRVKIRDNSVDDIEVIYMDNGQECSGSSVANYRDGKLVIGTVQKQTVVCDVKYLTT